MTNNNSLDANDVYQLSPGDLSDGQLVNIDRSHQFANLPPALQGLDNILAANDDKTAGPGFSIDVTFDAGRRYTCRSTVAWGMITPTTDRRWAMASWIGS